MATLELTPNYTAKRWPQLGSLEHILYFAQLSKNLKPKSLDELYMALSEHHVAESWAYFIAQNETPKRGTPEHNRSLDVRDLHGYKPGPIIDAEFHYEPVEDKRYIFAAGRRWPKAKRAYNLRMFLRDDLELDTQKPPEAYIHGGPYPDKTFRTFAYPEYKEDQPAVFLDILRTAASGLEQFVLTRDNS
ncbi:hypothetical protein KW801_02140 [Candidatus Saccharibacteria bacterium]|nr:hypothetical protein [Candidatus Saccharibacteria bacterium]